MRAGLSKNLQCWQWPQSLSMTKPRRKSKQAACLRARASLRARVTRARVSPFVCSRARCVGASVRSADWIAACVRAWCPRLRSVLPFSRSHPIHADVEAFGAPRSPVATSAARRSHASLRALDPMVTLSRSCVVALIALSTCALSACARKKTDSAAPELVCTPDDASGCERLARRYLTGEKVGRDVAKAAELFGVGCAAGLAASGYDLGVLHASGEGLPMDLKKAAGLYERACERGLAEACTNLGG